jgi:3-phosphoshikimate 1-carboxyvinyltransferase
VSDFLALPPVRCLSGAVRVPPSKSATNRALLLAALTEVPVAIAHPLESEDTAALRRCLQAMGASIVSTGDGLRVGGPLSGARDRVIALDAADSGTAARFLAAAAAATPGRFLLGGSPRLCERPMGELVEALRSGGARIAYRGRDGCLPLDIEGGALASGEVVVDAARSSQFLSALLLAGVAVEGGLRVRAAGRVASGPYVATTIEVLRDFGHSVETGAEFRVRRGPSPAERYDTPGDYSSAVPVAAAVGMAGGEVTLAGLRWPSADADAGALPVLEAMGIGIVHGPDGLTASASRGVMRAVSVAAGDFPDAVPALAALAAVTPGETVFSGVGHLRLKESDRLAALAALVGAVGARAAVTEDALVVVGPAAREDGATTRLSTFRDHRIAMAAGLLALRLPGLLIEDPGCVAKSYPAFFRDLEALARR